MKISSKTHNGMKICHILAVNYNKQLLPASELSKMVGVSAKYVEQIVRVLQKRDIITAQRGAMGGYKLTRSPSEIHSGEIVRAFEDDLTIIGCVTRDASCKCCPTSVVWKKLYVGINEILNDITLEDIIKGE